MDRAATRNFAMYFALRPLAVSTDAMRPAASVRAFGLSIETGVLWGMSGGSSIVVASRSKEMPKGGDEIQVLRVIALWAELD